jgi:hypothetical protein
MVRCDAAETIGEAPSTFGESECETATAAFYRSESP